MSTTPRPHPPDHMSACLRALLANRFNARLAGSWATDEAHLPRRNGNHIKSLSDVDVLVDATVTSDRAAEIASCVSLLAQQHGVEVSKVSVRCRSEIEGFWDPSHVSVLTQSPQASGRFLAFWALIGAIEALSSPTRVTETGRAYLLIKFFFKLCRNTLLVRGHTPASYRQLTAAVVHNLIAHPAVLRAYQIKVGLDKVMPPRMCEALLSPVSWAPLIQTMVDKNSADLLTSLRQDIDAWYRVDTALDIESYIDQLHALEEPPERAPARIKAVNDHRRQPARSTA